MDKRRREQLIRKMAFQKRADVPKEEAKVLTPKEAEDYKRQTAANNDSQKSDK